MNDVISSLLHDYGLQPVLIVFALLVYWGRRRQKWCPNCQQASCIAIGQPLSKKQPMSCPKCGFNKQVDVTHQASGGDGVD